MTTLRPPAPPEESDRIPGRSAFAIGLLGLAILALAVGCSTWLLRRETTRLGAHAKVLRGDLVVETHANGRLEQTLIESTASGWARRAAQARVLSHYAWVDRGRHVAHVPIARAMEIVAARGDAP